MYENEVLRLYPGRRVKAFDGMAVTADVWDTVQEYHRRMLEIHTRFAHGPGIVYGLEVIAGEPPSNQVYVQPGIAVDPLGRTIILSEARGYDLRAGDGLVYLVLTHEETPPRTEGRAAGDDAPRYVYTEYSLQATNAPPQTPYVELARIRRDGAAAVSNAVRPELPARNEIDMRHRATLTSVAPPLLSVAVVGVGGAAAGEEGHARGAALLGRAVHNMGRMRVAVDALPALDRSLDAHYGLLYLVGQDAFRLTSDQMTALFNFYQQGGSIFYESCREKGTGDPGGDASFLNFLNSMDQKVAPLGEDNRLLMEPHFFPAPPDGFETQGSPRIQIGEGILFSSFDYGCLWQGKRRGRRATRSEVRAAYEWGENILAWALRRRQAKP